MQVFYFCSHLVHVFISFLFLRHFEDDDDEDEKIRSMNMHLQLSIFLLFNKNSSFCSQNFNTKIKSYMGQLLIIKIGLYLLHKLKK